MEKFAKVAKTDSRRSRKANILTKNKEIELVIKKLQIKMALVMTSTKYLNKDYHHSFSKSSKTKYFLSF